MDGGYHPTMNADPRIQEAVRLLRAGRLVAFPTETVYGLGADAANPAAVARIFAAKGRPATHPVIVHLGGVEQLDQWAADFPEAARRLAARFWPGPLTLVLPRARAVPDQVTGGQETVALRVPAHPLARTLLTAFGGGIAAPSANRYGRISPTRAEHVRAELDGAVDLILDGGDCEVGLESTIVSCLDGRVALLRPGQITRAELEAVVGPLDAVAAGAPRVPGAMASHYAPTTPLVLVPPERLDTLLAAAHGQCAVLARRTRPPGTQAALWREMPVEPSPYGHDLYAALRELDGRGADLILVEQVPAGEAWDAVRDRLERAATATPAGIP